MPQKGMRTFPWMEDIGRFTEKIRVKTGIAHGHRPNKNVLGSSYGNDGRTWTDTDAACATDGSTFTNLDAVCATDGSTFTNLDAVCATDGSTFGVVA